MSGFSMLSLVAAGRDIEPAVEIASGDDAARDNEGDEEEEVIRLSDSLSPCLSFFLSLLSRAFSLPLPLSSLCTSLSFLVFFSACLSFYVFPT
jgi:hypothetical protein